MSLLKPADKLASSPEVVLREDFDDIAVLFHPVTPDAVGLSPVGVAIWKALDGQRALAEVAAAVATQFDGCPATILDDTIAFATDLYRRLFVLLVPEAP